MQERIASTIHGSITSVQAVYVPADDLTDPAPATTFTHLDATTVLSRKIAELGIYPAVDPLDSTSRILDANIVGKEHYDTAQRVKQILQRNKELQAMGDEVRIDDKVAKILADSLGTDLTKIVGALQKLVDGRPEGVKVIDADLVERNVGISKDFNAFELQTALVEGNVVKANRIAQYFATSKDHPMIKELGILYGFFANLMIYHYLPDKSDRVAAPILGISPYFVKDYAAAARRFSAGKTFAIIGYFRDIDARLKGINNPSAKDADLWKELIYKILH